MKKIKYVIASLLCFVFLSSVIIGIASKITVHADEFDLTKNYWELTTDDLERLTRRSEDSQTNSQTNSQITVFTHGWDSEASHWSNDANYNFAYQDDSMVDKLYETINNSGQNVSLFFASVEEFEMADGKRDLKKEGSLLLTESENNGGASVLQKM